MTKKTKKNKKNKTLNLFIRDVNMVNATKAEAIALLKIQNEKEIAKAVRNSKTDLGNTIKRILKHPENKGKTTDDILHILASKTRKGKAGEAIVATSFNEDSFLKGKLHPHRKRPGDIFAKVNPKPNETGRDILVNKVNNKGKSIEIMSQEIKTGKKVYVRKQSKSGKYKDIVTNKENLKSMKVGKIKKVMEAEGVKSKPYSEKTAIKKAHKVLKKQYKKEPPVSALEQGKILAGEAVNAGTKSAAVAAGVSTAIDLGTDILKGNKIDGDRAKEIGKNAANSAKNAALDTVTKTAATKVVEIAVVSKTGQAVVKKVAGKAASKVITKNVGKIAGPAGGFLIDSTVDVVKCLNGEQDVEETVKNVGLNVVNASLYATFPPAGAAMTAARICYSIWG